eukprot:scaffold136868_cov32-Tisochrysis_lutea.AAC.1
MKLERRLRGDSKDKPPIASARAPYEQLEHARTALCLYSASIMPKAPCLFRGRPLPEGHRHIPQRERGLELYGRAWGKAERVDAATD